MTIRMKILDVKQSEYDEVVQDQKIIVELPNGEVIALFDPDVLVDPSTTGEEVDIEIGTLATDEYIRRISPTAPRIEPSDDSPVHWNNHVFIGGIDSIDSANEQEYRISLDVGLGSIEVRARKGEFDDLTVGDFLRVDAIRSDVIGIDS